MKYIIAGLDEKSGNDLKKILDEHGILDFMGRFITTEIAENAIGGEPPDMAFIRMDKAELNACKLTNLIRKLNPFSKVIFLSSEVEYAVQAFECEVDGFLLIPFDKRKIEHLLGRCVERY